MTENEARLILDVRISRFDHAGDVNEALEIAKQALKEVQQYRAIGTVEEIKDLLVTISEASEDVDESGISVGLIKDLIRLGKYREIGTVEDCREADVREDARKSFQRQPYPTVDVAQYLAQKFKIGVDADGQEDS